MANEEKKEQDKPVVPEFKDTDAVVVTLPEEGEPTIELAKEPVVEKKEPEKKAAEAKVEKKEEKKKVEKTEEEIPGLKELQAQLDAAKKAAEDERVRRVEIEKQSEKQQQDVHKFRNEAERSQYDMVVNAIAGVESEAELAQSSYEAALTAGEFDKASKAQRIMARAEAKLLQLEEGKSAMEVRIERAKTEKPEIKKADPFETYVSQFSSPTQVWLRQHPQCVSDQRYNSKTIAAHHDAVAEGIAVDSPEYFGFIEEHLGFRKPEDEPEVEKANGKAAPKKNYSAAPSRESTPTSSGGKNYSSRSITLSSEQREAARASGVSEIEYAKQLLALQEDGTIGRPN